VFSEQGAVCVLPVFSDDSVLLIKQYRFGVDEALLELCAGTLEIGEDPSICAVRELEEETGYTSKNIKPFSLPAFFPSPGVLSEKMYVFVARDLIEVGHRQEDSEFIQNLKFTRDEIRTLLSGGKIVDAKTALVLSLWLQFSPQEEK